MQVQVTIPIVMLTRKILSVNFDTSKGKDSTLAETGGHLIAFGFR